MQRDPMTLATELCEHLRKGVLQEDVLVSPSSAFMELGLDSMSIIELVMFLERKYGIVLPDEALRPEHLRSAESLARCAVAVESGTFRP